MDTTTIDTTSTEIRTLTQHELETTQGGWLLNAAGAVVGGISSGAGAYISSGGSWKATGLAAAGGAAAGAILPWTSIRSAAQSAGRSLISGTVVGAGNRVMEGPAAPTPPQQ